MISAELFPLCSLPPPVQEGRLHLRPGGLRPGGWADSRPCVPQRAGPRVCSHLGGGIGVQRAGGRQLSAETLMRFGAGGQREGADRGLPPPRGAAQGRGGERRVAEGKEPEGRVKGRGAGRGCLWVAVRGGRKCSLAERGLDGGVAPRALEAYGTTESHVTCHNLSCP